MTRSLSEVIFSIPEPVALVVLGFAMLALSVGLRTSTHRKIVPSSDVRSSGVRERLGDTVAA